jgi:DNA-binding HxlR family transcriptional regulator
MEREKMENTVTDERCPVEAVSEIIGRKWVSLILRDLAIKPQRFGQLEHSIKVSPRILSMRLQELESEGLITRQVFAEVPPRTEYTLTERGQLLVPVIDTMRAVGQHFI